MVRLNWKIFYDSNCLVCMMFLRVTRVSLLYLLLLINSTLQEHVPQSEEGLSQDGEMPEEIPVTETVEAEVEATIEAEVEAPDEEDKTDEAQEQKITPYPCIDYRTLPDSVLSDPPSVLNVTSQQLNDILQDESVANRCAIVYFYASWSYYSCEYAYQYNALGRAFNSLPILAVDLHYNDM